MQSHSPDSLFYTIMSNQGGKIMLISDYSYL